MASKLQNERARTIRLMKIIIKPHLNKDVQGAGAILEGVKVSRYWVPVDCTGSPTGQTFKLKGANLFRRVCGFTNKGIIFKDKRGCSATAEFDGPPLKDLVKIVKWAESRFIPARQVGNAENFCYGP